MITNYFKSNSGKSSTSNELTLQPPPKKAKHDTKKRNGLTGYTPLLVKEAVERMKKSKESGGWRKFEQVKMKYTIITKDWCYNNNLKCREWQLCPLGMVETVSQRLGTKRSYATVQMLSPKTKESLGIVDDEEYDKTKISLTVGNMGDLGIKEFTHIYCQVCLQGYVPQMLLKYKSGLPEEAKLLDLINNWDKLKIPTSLLDLAGCFFPNEKHVAAGPNGRRFIIRPCEHPAFHSKIQVVGSKIDGKESPSTTTSQSLERNVSVIVQKKSDKTTSSTSGLITLRNNANIKMRPVSDMIDPSIELSTACFDDVDKWAKRFMLKTIHTGVNKTVSNEASLEFYGTVIEGCRDYHKTVLKSVVVDNKSIPPPPKVKVNRNNIHIPQKSILTAIQESPKSQNPYNILLNQQQGKYYSIMHDGIQKFGMELNGVIVRTLDTDMQVVNVPWMLKEIAGGSLNADKLVIHVMSVIGSIQYKRLIQPAASVSVSEVLLKDNDALPFPKPPHYFAHCTLLDFDLENKIISLDMPAWPVAINGDGCSTNTAAGGKLVERFGLLSPNMRCVVHAGDGSLKRMVNSKTMNVSAVTEFLPSFRKVMKHFKLSGKSTCSLNEVLAIMGMKKVHLVSFCPTRMAYLLTCCKLSVNLLVPLCDVMVTLDLKKEERDSFMSPRSMFIMHILADLDPVFKKELLKILDGDDCLVINAYRINSEFHLHLASGAINFPCLSKFLSNITEDQNGNIVASLSTSSGEIHNVTLNTSHRQRRSVTSRIDEYKKEAEDIKEQIVGNLVENVKSQAQSGTIVEYASAFDMFFKISLDQRITYLRQLGKIYCTTYTHKVVHVDEEEFWEQFEVSIRYPAKIESTVEELEKEFRDIWPVCNKLWPKFIKDKQHGNQRLWQEICKNYTINYPNLCELVKILFSVASSTGPLERSYSKLAKICYKDRNRLTSEHLEVLYLLSLLNDQDVDYDAAIKIMEKSN